MTEKIYIGGRDLFGEVVLAREQGKGVLQGYWVRRTNGEDGWLPREFFERVYRKMTGEEQMFVLFGGDKWPAEKPPLKINKIDPFLTAKEWKQPEGESWFQRKFINSESAGGPEYPEYPYCGFCGQMQPDHLPNCNRKHPGFHISYRAFKFLEWALTPGVGRRSWSYFLAHHRVNQVDK